MSTPPHRPGPVVRFGSHVACKASSVARPEGEDGPQPRVIHFQVRTIAAAAGTVVAVVVVLALLWSLRQILVWLAIAIFLAVAMNPLVVFFERIGLKRRGLSVLAATLVVLAAFAGIGALIIPTLIDQVNGLISAAPDYLDELTHGRGRLGFLETDYHIVERVRERVSAGGDASKVLGFAGPVIKIIGTGFSLAEAALAIATMTILVLLNGPGWLEGMFEAMPEESAVRWRAVADDISSSVGGYIRGNLLMSLIAGVAAYLELMLTGVPYAVALGLVIAIFDLLPLVGATLGAVIVGAAAFADSTTSLIIWVIFAIVYQQLENHLLQPVIYGRSVQLPALAVIVAVLAGAQIGGILGALLAIPVAGTIRVLLVDWWRFRHQGGLGHRVV
jgi:predicted PurR-regulated permease PerM